MNAMPWMEAFERRADAVKKLQEVGDTVKRVQAAERQGMPKRYGSTEEMQNKIGVLMEYEPDLEAMKVADVFAWFDPAIEAVWQASKTVPTDLPLGELLIPKTSAGSGWWWFDRMLPVPTHEQQDDYVAALLWAYTDDRKALRFSAYTILNMDNTPFTYDRTNGKMYPIPSTLWHWPLTMSLDDMIAESKAGYDRAYGHGGVYEHCDTKMGEEFTMTAITALARFFFAACSWLGQSIIETSDGHIDRHARKRAQREFKVEEVPPVRVIALRHTVRGEQEGASQTTDGRTYNCQWVVSGHWRKQPYGPHRMGRKLVFIHPYVKGPEDKPLKPKQEKLFVVKK